MRVNWYGASQPPPATQRVEKAARVSDWLSDPYAVWRLMSNFSERFRDARQLVLAYSRV